MARSESGLRQRIRTAIRRGWPSALVVGQPANGLTGPGRHDLYVVVAGRYCGLEVKVRNNRTSAARLAIQSNRIRETRRAGGHAWFVYSVEGALQAVRFAKEGYPPMPEGTQDMDEFLASLGIGPVDATEAEIASAAGALEPPSTAALEELPRFDDVITIPGEQEVANAALRNGTAAGDGDAVGEAQTSTQYLAEVIGRLERAVTQLGREVNYLRAAVQGKAPEPESSEAAIVEVTEVAPSLGLDASISELLGLGLEEPAADPPEPEAKPKRTRRRSS